MAKRRSAASRSSTSTQYVFPTAAEGTSSSPSSEEETAPAASTAAPVSAATQAATPSSQAPVMKKADAIRAVLATGLTSPKAVVDEVMRKYGLEISSAQVSGLLSKSASTTTSRQSTPASTRSRTASPLLINSLGMSQQSGVSLEDLEALKKTAKRVGGWERLGELIEMLSTLHD